MTLESAIEYAAEKLPDGFWVELHAEKESAYIDLLSRDIIDHSSQWGDDEFSDPADDSLAERVRLAVEFAQKLAKESQ